MRNGFSGGGWESCFGQSTLPLNISVLSCSCSLPLLSLLLCLLILESPPPSHTSLVYLFCWYLTTQDFVFCLPWHPLVSSFWREGQKEDDGLKVCRGKFLEDVSGLCSQGTSCSQCEHGTLSMRSISMTIIFILRQSGSRQHSTTGGKKKKSPSSNSIHPL